MYVLFHSFYSRLCRFPWSVIPCEICDQSPLDLSFCSSQDRVQGLNMIFLWTRWEVKHIAASDEGKHPSNQFSLSSLLTSSDCNQFAIQGESGKKETLNDLISATPLDVPALACNSDFAEMQRHLMREMLVYVVP